MDSYFEKGLQLTGTLWVKGTVHFDAHDIKGVLQLKEFFVSIDDVVDFLKVPVCVEGLAVLD